jgi:catechol 2,3-dioxygenase-like lactoylglutathione lyase family enzyme
MRLNHVTVGATDVERSVGFYSRLGLDQIVADYPDYARLVVPDGESTPSLHRVDVVAAPTTTIHFECDDVDERVAGLKAGGFAFDLDPTDMPYRWREAILRDPDDNVIFLYTAGENRLNPPWRLG